MINKINSAQPNFNGKVSNTKIYKEYLSHLSKKDLTEHKHLIEKISKIDDGKTFIVSQGGEYANGTTRKYYGLYEDTLETRRFLAEENYLLKDKETEIVDYSNLKNLFLKPLTKIYKTIK